MKKIEKEYQAEYGHIPKNKLTRLCQMMDSYSQKRRKNMDTTKLNRLINMEWETFELTIWLLPKATPRPRFNGKNNIFYVKGAKDNRDIFAKFVKDNDLPMITTPCNFYCTSYFPIPKSMSKDEQILAEMGYIRPITKPDWDNIGKTYSDMIQSDLLFDDSLIIKGVSEKYYSIKPRIEIKIEYMKKHDSIYNSNKMRKKVAIDE